jgi:hypothetical protein
MKVRYEGMKERKDNDKDCKMLRLERNNSLLNSTRLYTDYRNIFVTTLE